MLFSWTPEVTLRQPARRVFVMLRAARDIETRKESLLLIDLTRVAMCGLGDPKFTEKVQAHFFERIRPAKFARPSKQIDNKTAAAALASILGTGGTPRAAEG